MIFFHFFIPPWIFNNLYIKGVVKTLSQKTPKVIKELKGLDLFSSVMIKRENTTIDNFVLNFFLNLALLKGRASVSAGA